MRLTAAKLDGGLSSTATLGCVDFGKPPKPAPRINLHRPYRLHSAPHGAMVIAEIIFMTLRKVTILEQSAGSRGGRGGKPPASLRRVIATPVAAEFLVSCCKQREGTPSDRYTFGPFAFRMDPQDALLVQPHDGDARPAFNVIFTIPRPVSPAIATREPIKIVVQPVNRRQTDFALTMWKQTIASSSNRHNERDFNRMSRRAEKNPPKKEQQDDNPRRIVRTTRGDAGTSPKAPRRWAGRVWHRRG